MAALLLRTTVIRNSIAFGSQISSDLPKSVSAEISAETEISVNTTEIHISVNNKLHYFSKNVINYFPEKKTRKLFKSRNKTC